MAYFIIKGLTKKLAAVFLPLLLLSSNLYALLQLDDNEQLKKTSIEIINKLKLNHYRYLSIDDDFSSKLFDRYIDQIDPAKNYLLQTDITAIEKYRLELDNALNRGDLRPASEIFNRYQQRLDARLEWIIRLLSHGVEQFDFTLGEALDTDYESRTWATSEEQLDEMWRKTIKLAVLNLKLADKPSEEIADLLLKRYKNQLNQIHQTNAQDVFQLYMNIVSQAYDPHTEYFAPRRSENFNINMSLSLEGIGAVLQSDQEFTKVVSLVPGGPADLAGQLKPSDRITSVGQGTDEAMVDVIGWRLDDVVQLIRGPKETTVRLQVISKANGKETPPREIAIVRNKVLLENQAATSEIIEVQSETRNWKLGVIKIPGFYADFEAYHAGDSDYKSTTRDVHKLLLELQEKRVDGVIVDLRNNGGGSLNEANSLTGLFINQGPTVQIKNARGRVEVLNDPYPGTVYEGPLAVIVNRLSASASEIFAGAIQDYQRGIIIGGQTFGKGTVQTILHLSEGELKITQAKFYRISGESTQHRGVVPDISLPDRMAHDDIGEDTLVDALPWDSIRPLLYKTLEGYSAANTALLETHHIERVKSDPDYSFLMAQLDWVQKNRSETQISLNEKKRIAEREADKQWLLEQENKRRQAKGLEPIAQLEEPEKEDSENPSDKDKDKENNPDVYLNETAKILIDSIKLTTPAVRVAAHE